MKETLHMVPKVHTLFNLHKFGWMSQIPGNYNNEIGNEF